MQAATHQRRSKCRGVLTFRFGPITCALLVVGAIGCAEPPAASQVASRTADVQSASEDSLPAVEIEALIAFDSAYMAIDSFTLKQDDENVVARVANVVIDEHRHVVFVVDASERNVKEFDFGGRLIKVYGRAGAGPGEFRTPEDGAIDPLGRLVVFDGLANRVTVFLPDSAPRVVQVHGMTKVRDFTISASGTYLFVAALASNEDVLFETSEDGTILQEALPLAHVVPEGETDGPLWTFPRTFFLSARQDTALVICSLLPRIWRVSLADHSVVHQDVVFPGYLPPRSPPRDKSTSTADVVQWFYSRHLTAFLTTTRKEVFWPFMHGEVMQNNPMVVVHQGPDGKWEALDGAPIILKPFADGRLLVYRDPTADAPRFVIYRRRP